MTVTWEQDGERTWRAIGYLGRRATVSRSYSQWRERDVYEAEIRYLDGPTIRGPHGYVTKAAALRWAERKLTEGAPS